MTSTALALPFAADLDTEEGRMKLAARAGAIVPAGLTPAAALALLKSAAPRTPRRARCYPCGHVWTVAFEPMDAERLARCIARATCPSCGESEQIGDVETIRGIARRAQERRDRKDLS